jgi:hypothetical protein
MGKPVATISHWDVGIALVCLALAVWLGILGTQKMALSAELNRRGEPAEATVVAVEHRSMNIFNGGLKEWTDVTVAFSDARGTPVRATRQGPESATIGDKVRVVYDPQYPTRARWGGAIDDALVDFFWSAAGLMVCIGSLIAARRAARRPPERPGQEVSL